MSRRDDLQAQLVSAIMARIEASAAIRRVAEEAAKDRRISAQLRHMERAAERSAQIRPFLDHAYRALTKPTGRRPTWEALQARAQSLAPDQWFDLISERRCRDYLATKPKYLQYR